MTEAHQRDVRDDQDLQQGQQVCMVLPNVTVLISFFFLTEGNKKTLIHKEKSGFSFSATRIQLHYAKDFGTTALESAKRMIQWSPFYFTHSTSYYPVPSTQIHLQAFPRMKQQNLPVMSSAQQDLMRN